jgi:arylsulfatase
VQKLRSGHKLGDTTYKVHIDGYNFLPYLTGDAEKGPRNEFFAYVDDGSLGAIRYGDYKAHFSTQDHHGMEAWLKGQTPRKAPLLVDLRADPFESAQDDSSYFDDWTNRRMFAIVPLMDLVKAHAATFAEFPPRQVSGSFTPKQ